MGGLNNLADQLFAEKPARQQEKHFDINGMVHRYVQSRIFGPSRGLDPNTHALPERLSDTAISDKVMNVELLGPYEHQILTSLLRAPHSFVVVTGSTGCGKTSTLRNVLEFYDANARLTGVEKQIGINPHHVYVDFNKLAHEFRQHEDGKKGSGLDFLYEKIPNRIVQAILKSVRGDAIKRKCSPTQVLLELAKVAYEWAAMEEEPPPGFQFDWPDLIGLGTPELTGKPDRDYQKFQTCLFDQAAQKSKSNLPLLFWCAILDVLAIKARPTGKDTLVLLDNIDPLPDEVQMSLRDQFMNHCLGKNFKVVMALRHSRFHLHGKARLKHTVEFNWYPHCGPSPVELVSERLLGFICTPQSYPAYRDLEPDWRDKAVYRALELLLRLVRGAHGYRSLCPLALAGAGDSVRRALDTVRFLFESTELSFNYSLSTDAKKAFGEMALELQTISCTNTVGLALREEIVGIAMECDDRDNIERQVLHGSPIRLAKIVKNIILRSFQSSESYQDQRVNNLWKTAEIKKLCEEDVEAAARLLRARMISCGIAEKLAEDYLTSFAESFSHELKSYFTGLPGQPDGLLDLISAIGSWLRESTLQTANAIDQDEIQEFPLVGEALRKCASVLSTNKPHMIAKSLVRNGYLHDLFVDGRGNLSTLSLTLLYYMANQDEGEVPLHAVLEHLSRRANEEEVLRLINSFCNEKVRILWINEEFSHDSLKELQALASTGKTMRLTHGGWAYYYGVLDEFDYMLGLLWMRDRPHRHEELLSSRVKVALGKLEKLVELSKCKTKNELEAGQWESIERGAVADVVVRCTPGFVRAVRGHFKKMQQIETRLPAEERIVESMETRQVVISWQKLLRSLEDQEYYAVASAEELLSLNKIWQLMPLARTGGFRGLGPAVGGFQGRHKSAAEALDRLLNGDDLWLLSWGSRAQVAKSDDQ